MKYFKLLTVLTLCLTVFNSCDESGESGESKIDPDGPELEITVESFDSQNNKTKIKLVNRNAEAITSIRGRLNFMDSDGENLMTATGRIIDSPFQKSSNPNIVKSMEATTFELKNEIPENTAEIVITEVAATLKNGDKIGL